MRFRLHRLAERLDRLPMLRALLPFAAGVLLAGTWQLPWWLPATAVLVSGALAALFRSPAAMAVLLVAAGFGQTQLREPRRSVPVGVTTRFDLRIEGLPSVRENYATVEAVAEAWKDPQTDAWIASGDRLLLYADPLTPLPAGERLLCRGRIRDLRGDSTGYRRLMQRRGIAGTLWVAERNIVSRRSDTRRTLHARAVERLTRLGLSDRAEPLARALAAGDRSRFTPDLRDRYARSGLSHLLAVSGLHTGMLFGWLWLLLGWMTLFRRGDRMLRIVCVAAVWLFVAAAGFPPSAVRAAILCTLLQGALWTGRVYDAGNALAAAAFVMLLWQPAWIGDISFQLSFLAVAALLCWGVPLQRRLRTHRRLPDALLGAWVVSLVAGAATAPLAAHTFGVVPLAGILLNPVALLPAAAIVLLGAVWIAFPFAGWAPLLRGGIESSAAALDALTRTVGDLPFGSLAWQPDAAVTGCIYLGLLLLTLLAGCCEREAENRIVPKK